MIPYEFYEAFETAPVHARHGGGFSVPQLRTFRHPPVPPDSTFCFRLGLDAMTVRTDRLGIRGIVSAAFGQGDDVVPDRGDRDPSFGLAHHTQGLPGEQLRTETLQPAATDAWRGRRRPSPGSPDVHGTGL